MNNVKQPGLKTEWSTSASALFSFLLFLFFIQQITFLVESIYTLNLLNTSIDGKVLGLLFLALPVLLFFVRHKRANYTIIISLMLFCVFMSPLLPTPFRIFSSGLGAGLFLLYLALQFSDSYMHTADWGSASALATLTSVAFRALGHTLDISISGNTKFIGWILVLVAIPLAWRNLKKYPLAESNLSKEETGRYDPSLWLSILGLAGSMLLIYFAVSSPGVITRWTGSNYNLIHIVLCISILIFAVIGPDKFLRFPRIKEGLLAWNIIFLLMLLLTILFSRVPFPELPESAPVVVSEVSLFGRIATYLMLILSPVIFIDITLFSQSIKPSEPAGLARPFLAAVALMILSIFILIFSNTWGYAKPVSALFRNQFHLAFALAGIFLILPCFFIKRNEYGSGSGSSSPRWSRDLSFLLVAICFSALYSGKNKQADSGSENIKELTLMTYNIQQGVDFFGNKNYEGQLALINEIDPDIVCLQESDASRISGGNSDVVRYFTDNLGFYSYYGPATVTGTFGTAILSRFPLDSNRTVFTYSNKDEIGTAVSMITVGNKNITLINSHPAGNEKARKAHIENVARLAKENEMVIALGDYNFRQDSPFYKKITAVLNDAWISIYPDAVGSVETDKLDSSIGIRNRSSGLLLTGNKLDMRNRIDHIFLSEGFKVVEAHYLPAPESGSDHPAHWAVVRW